MLGFVIFLLGFELPGTISKTLKTLGSITTPLSMLAVGAMLAGSSIRVTLQSKRLYLLSLVRLIVLPLAVFAILRHLAPNFFLAAIPAIITAMPAAANTAILAQEYGANEGLASRAIFLTTLLSILSIPLIAFIIARWGMA